MDLLSAVKLVGYWAGEKVALKAVLWEFSKVASSAVWSVARLVAMTAGSMVDWSGHALVAYSAVRMAAKRVGKKGKKLVGWKVGVLAETWAGM